MNAGATSVRTTAQQAASIKGQVRELESVVEPDSFEAKILPSNLTSAVLYAGLFGQADLEYVVCETSLKENIIVNSKATEYKYAFWLDTDGLTPTLQETGSITLSDATGEAIFTIPAGYMIDADGESSMDVEYSLEEGGNGRYLLTVTADADWLNAQGRAFPVTISIAQAHRRPHIQMKTDWGSRSQKAAATIR